MTTISSVTSSTRPGNPLPGDAYFETDTKNLIIYDGNTWRIYNKDGSSSPTFPNIHSAELSGISSPSSSVVYDSSTDGSQTSLGDFTGSMSFVLWYRQNPSPLAYEVIISSFHNLTAADGVSGKFDMDISSGTGLRTFTSDGGAVSSVFTLSPVLENDSWNFVAYVVDQGTSAHYSYIGKPSQPPVKYTKQVTKTLQDFSNGFKIGEGVQDNLNGYVDDFAIFDGKALSQSEIETIWNNGRSFNFADDSSLNPVGWFRMGDDNSGQGTFVKNAVNADSTYDAELRNAAFSPTVY